MLKHAPSPSGRETSTWLPCRALTRAREPVQSLYRSPTRLSLVIYEDYRPTPPGTRWRLDAAPPGVPADRPGPASAAFLPHCVSPSYFTRDKRGDGW